MRIATGVLKSDEIQRHSLQHIPAEGMLLEPRQTVVMEADGYPVIIFTTGIEMMVAHTKNADVIDAIIETFRSRGVLPLRIRMSIQMYIPKQESAFVDRALKAGIRHVWAANPIAEVLTHARAPIEEKNFVTIRRVN